MKNYASIVKSTLVALAILAGSYSVASTLNPDVHFVPPVQTASATEVEITPVTTKVENVVADVPVEEVTIPDYYNYTVVLGDTLYDLAKRWYGNGNYYTYIVKWNEKADAHIDPDDVLKMYTYEILMKQVEADKPAMRYIGNFRITGYDPYCRHCCGKSNGITASGRKAELGVTAGSNSLPLGTKVYIEGVGYYRIDDRGGSSKNLIDIACSSHNACYQITRSSAKVYIVE